ncbi:PT domain-containing protein [Actinocorallia sp. B10E7]|uniref:PT domain-containing protein n=1 Tax=Actinocorallia sp. B10E7 TaxID=3153558 RepID=UPI00325CF91A
MNKIIRLTGGIALAGALLFTSACGGGDGTSGDSGNSTDMSAFQDCLKEQGVTMPEGNGGGRPPGMPTGRPSGMPTDRPSGNPTDKPSGNPTDRPSGRPSGGPSMSTEMQAAMKTCASLRPEAPQGGPGGQPQDGG